MGRFVGGFLLFRCLGEYELQVGEGGEYFFVKVAVQFCLEGRGNVLRCVEYGISGSDGGVRNVFVFEKHHA